MDHDVRGDRAEECDLMARRPTVYDVAERAGVSIATVSFAFAQPERVRKKTLDTVLAAAAALGYVPNVSARGLAKGRTGAIGLYSFSYLLDDGERDELRARAADDARLFPLYSDLVQRGVELECRRRGLALMLGSGTVPDDLPAVVDVAGRVDGLIAFAGAAPAEALARIARRIPVVELGGETTAAGTRTVLVDHRSGMRRLVEHLLREHGHRRFTYVGEESVTAEFAERFGGYSDALTAAGLAVDPPLPSAPAKEATTRAALAPVLARGHLPDVLVCATDQEALVVLNVLRDAGIDVPGQVAVTGFDGIIATRLSSPPLTTVQQPMEAIGRTAVRLLLEEETGEVGPLPTEPVIRASCGCLSSN
ncbi:LacI family DNA-binding transcriptional regulator [Lentzea aerocolonigenes]|uniref:LacI family DNA-binding transcriptional regulator n=1 Tax=Lentzea aerocolonigenes TaxID=68170 RepID=UPI00191BD23E|nr:LacI family DNA-binding transcriptional regulator [Lentzea aerocolonigenes]